MQKCRRKDIEAKFFGLEKISGLLKDFQPKGEDIFGPGLQKKKFVEDKSGAKVRYMPIFKTEAFKGYKSKNSGVLTKDSE